MANSSNGDRFDDPTKDYKDDEDGDTTIEVLRSGLKIAKRITGNSGESLGLHPAVYFITEQGRYSRFLFLGMVAAIAEKLRNNDSNWFLKFTRARKPIESFMIEHKSLIGIVLQNLAKPARIPKMREMFNFIVREADKGNTLTAESVINQLGLSTRIYDVKVPTHAVEFSDDTKSAIYYRDAIKREHACPICGGLLDVAKSVSYDHKVRRREAGLGTAENGQMVHPYCDTAVKN